MSEDEKPAQENSAEKDQSGKQEGFESESAESPGSSESTSNGSTKLGKLDDETRERIEQMMYEMITRGEFGYKGKTDPVEREVAIQSEAMAEKLFAHLYADDPENAKKKWQTYSSKPADDGLIARAKNFHLEDVNGPAISSLEDEQTRTLDTVKKFYESKSKRNLEGQVSNLRVALGDAVNRKKDFRRKANSEVLAKEQDVDGLTILKSFFQGTTKVAADYLSATRQKIKENEIKNIIKEITLNAGTQRVNVIQDIKGGGFHHRGEGPSGPDSQGPSGMGGPGGQGFNGKGPDGKGPDGKGPDGKGPAGAQAAQAASSQTAQSGSDMLSSQKQLQIGASSSAVSNPLNATRVTSRIPSAKVEGIRNAVSKFQTTKQAGMLAAIPGANQARILMTVVSKVREAFNQRKNQKGVQQQGIAQGMLSSMGAGMSR